MLLQDIITRMDDFQQLQAAEKHLRRAKDDGIEASGALMRRLAMGELEDELQGDTASADDEHKEGDDAGQSGDNARATSTGSKIPITEMNKGDPEKYAFFNSRFQFEKDEAEKSREHEIKMELHRQEAERARDERLLAAERERENFMMRLMEIALGQSNTNK
ncbi:hypothetical protein PC121_g22979 [Phytophthora cactorum]|nr:hypothetical protein PC120_g25876 [Phytophthora cactorum]KAG3042752.1 hypothetical protein PC121_g22979 [Phytophthora cactorum]